MSDHRPDASREHREHPEPEIRSGEPRHDEAPRRVRWDKILNPLTVLVILAVLIGAMLVIYAIAS